MSETCRRLGIGNTTYDSSEEPRMVGLAGPGGAGKSTVASMVIARVDVRASFNKGVLWLRVGPGAKDNLPEVMFRLAGMVYETVMLRECRPPRKDDLVANPEDGAAYIREVVDESSQRFLVVADDVWDVEVLEALRRAAVWVLYTTRQDNLLPEAPPLRLDKVLKEEAEMVLRRAADLDDDEHLPGVVNDLMVLCDFRVMYLVFVGRSSDVRGKGRGEGKAWLTALRRIEEAQKGSKGGQPLTWHAAVLQAGLEELARDNPLTEELYLSLAVIPKELAFPPEVAAVLLYGGSWSAAELDAAKTVLATLERRSILTLEDGGKYRVHDEHADFIRGRFAVKQGTQDSALPRWREYISTVWALLAFSSGSLVKIWAAAAQYDGGDVIPRPFNMALASLDPSSPFRRTAFRRAAFFHVLREDWLEAFSFNSQLLEIEDNTSGLDLLDVARTLHSLGKCSGKTGKKEEAKKLFDELLRFGRRRWASITRM